jgi:chromate transporter
LVERRRWLTREEFLEELAVAQALPGPNVVNLALMVGARSFGLRGALTAMAGMLAIPLLIVLALAMLHAQFAQLPQVAGALRGMSAVAAGMIIATGLRLVVTLRGHPLGIWGCLLLGGGCFALAVVLRWPLAWVLPALGIPAWALTRMRLHQ